MFHPEYYRGRVTEFKCFALLCLFNDTCMILLALHKLSGKDDLCPGSYLDYGSPGFFFFFNGLRGLWIVDIVQWTILVLYGFCTFNISSLCPKSFVVVTRISHPVLLDPCPFLEGLQLYTNATACRCWLQIPVQLLVQWSKFSSVSDAGI